MQLMLIHSGMCLTLLGDFKIYDCLCGRWKNRMASHRGNLSTVIVYMVE